MNRVVFRPGRFDGTGEGEDVFLIEFVVRGWRGREPIFAVFYRVLRILANVIAWIWVSGISSDVLEAPFKRLDAAVVVGGPTPVLVAADFAFKPVHGR